MKKVFKVLGFFLLFLVIVVGGLISYVKVALPNVGPPTELKINYTPERIARGEYLSNHVTVCMDCHSTRDWTKFSGPLTPGTLGKGGEHFDQALGFPGAFLSRNITPKGISRYTDGELFRVITTGVTKEGRAMFPVMPYPYYSKMDPEDIMSIIAYIRSLPPIDNDVPASVPDFPMSVIINTIPKKATPGTRPDESNTLAYGAYLLNASGCIECHTPAKQGQIIQALAFSGGREFNLPDGSVLRSANITASPTTGIGNWTEDAFVNRFKSYVDSNYHPPTVEKGAFNTIMPWTMYGGMKRSDLAAIYAYLHSQPGKENTVVKFTPPPAVAKK
jgi:mono/diheme cytochrome c family protein